MLTQSVRRLLKIPVRFASLIESREHIQRLLRAPRLTRPVQAAGLVRSVNLIIEPRCNLECQNCHYLRGRSPTVGLDAPDLHRMLGVLDEIPSASVAVTGGEPLLAPERAVEAVRFLVRRGRKTTLVTNCLLLGGPSGNRVRETLLNGLSFCERTKIDVRCSIDTMHCTGSRLRNEDYAQKVHAAIRFFSSAGFTVYARAVVTTAEDYCFYRTYVAPLAVEKVIRAASWQPDLFRLEAFVRACARGGLAEVRRELNYMYVRSIIAYTSRTNSAPVGSSSGLLRSPHRAPLSTTPWSLVEISSRGVRGPSPFVRPNEYHSSVVEMLRSYDWIKVIAITPPQITIAHNAAPYKVDHRTRSVSFNMQYLLRRAMSSIELARRWR